MLILENSRKFMSECTEEECTSTLSRENKLMSPIYVRLHLDALKIEKVCNGLQKGHTMDFEECEKGK